MTGPIQPKWWEWLLAIPYLIVSFIKDLFRSNENGQ